MRSEIYNVIINHRSDTARENTGALFFIIDYRYVDVEFYSNIYNITHSNATHFVVVIFRLLALEHGKLSCGFMSVVISLYLTRSATDYPFAA